MQDDDLRKRLWKVAGAILIILIVLVLVVMFLSREKETAPVSTVDTPQVGEQPQFEPVDAPPPTRAEQLQQTPPDVFVPVSDEDAMERYARQKAQIFVERFGSYSNQNDNRHISDVEPLITVNMRRWVEQQGLVQSEVYQGLNTRVISTEVISISENNAVVKVGAQVTTKSSDGTTETTIKRGRVELVKAGPEEWLVNGLYWD